MPAAAQRNEGDTTLLSRQRKPSCGGQIKLFRVTPRLEEDGTKRLTSQRFFRRAQRFLGIRNRDQNKACRV